jgi:hypothetical protein
MKRKVAEAKIKFKQYNEISAITEIKKRLSQDNLDTKALELACLELSGWDCPPISSGYCQMQALALSRHIYQEERTETCAACWIAVLRQETADVDK